MSYVNKNQQLKEKKDAIELCGKNRGAHNYKVVAWTEDLEQIDEKNVRKVKQASRLLCTTCLCTVDMKTLLLLYRDLSYYEKHDIY